ncbi:MAG: hydroxysqualene dehydroxylase HpnE [bacterium]
MTYDAIIIGGGLAGLSAAVDLSAKGCSVLLLEQAPHLGGRVYSFIDSTTGDRVDNGQHLLMGCYHATRRFLHEIGSAHLAVLQPQLRIDYLGPDEETALLKCTALPSPFNLLSGLLRLQSLSIRERGNLLRVGIALQKPPDIVEPLLREMTVEEWLMQLGQSELARSRFWNIVAIGALNNDPATASALLFYRVLRAVFSGDSSNASLMIPAVGLSELFSTPALHTLRNHNAQVLMGTRVSQFRTEGRKIVGVQCADGSVFRARTVIAAIPPASLQKLLQTSGLASLPLFNTLQSFQASSILGINLWFDREVMQQEFVALLESPIHWIFNKTRISRHGSLVPQHLALVISAADEYMGMEKQQILSLVTDELKRYLPLSRGANLVQSIVIKAKRATFLQTPAVESLRPQAATPISNLFLAGDWMDTGYPATIEGAVLSGVTAAQLVIKSVPVVN